jgi:hypothetical protein
VYFFQKKLAGKDESDDLDTNMVAIMLFSIIGPKKTQNEKKNQFIEGYL